MTRADLEQVLTDNGFEKFCEAEQEVYNGFYYHNDGTACWTLQNLMLEVSGTKVVYQIENDSLGIVYLGEMYFDNVEKQLKQQEN